MYFSGFVADAFSVVYNDSFHFKYRCLVNGSADAVFSNKYAGLCSSLADQTVTIQFSLSICDCSRMCFSDFEKRGLNLLDKVSRPFLHSNSSSKLMSLISLGWKDLFLSWRKLFLCSHEAQAIFQILLCVLERRSCED